MKPNVFLRNKGLNFDFKIKGSDFDGTLQDLLNEYKQALAQQCNIHGVSITLPLKYNDHTAEIEGQTHTLSYCPNLDDYTDITEAFKKGMKKQIELLNKGN